MAALNGNKLDLLFNIRQWTVTAEEELEIESASAGSGQIVPGDVGGMEKL